MKTVETRYYLQGCNPNCIFCGPEEIEEYITKHHHTKEEYKVRNITPICLNNIARAEAHRIREDVYKRADLEKHAYLENSRNRNIKTNIATLRHSNKIWRKIADEWNNYQCPFFTAPTLQKESLCHQEMADYDRVSLNR